MGRPPSSPGAAREAILRGPEIANTAPQGPVYINFDAELQEMKVSDELPPIDVARYHHSSQPRRRPTSFTRRPACSKTPSSALSSPAAHHDAEASKHAWRLAEALNARVVTDLKTGASSPTDHPFYIGSPRAPESVAGFEKSGVVCLSLDYDVDLAGALRSASAPSAKVIHSSIIASITR